MEVINPFLQDNKQRIIAFLDEISASSVKFVDIPILRSMFCRDCYEPPFFYCLQSLYVDVNINVNVYLCSTLMFVH